MQGWQSSVDRFERDEFTRKLAASARTLLEAIDGVTEWTPERDRLLAQVVEHARSTSRPSGAS